MQLSTRAPGAGQLHHCSRNRVASRCTRVQAQRPFTTASPIRPAPAAPAAAVAAAGLDRAQQKQRTICRAEAVEQTPVTLPRTGSFISKTEVPAFIQRDDMMDQIIRWALIEAEEGGQRNFGMPMKVHQRFRDGELWGMDIEIIKEGVNVADLSIGFDGDVGIKSEWIGQDANGFPTKEGKQEEVAGKHFEIWCVWLRARRRRQQQWQQQPGLRTPGMRGVSFSLLQDTHVHAAAMLA